jgi:replicative DNA helicase
MTPIQTGEQIFLAQMMISGNLQDYPVRFSDPRHREIYNHLAHLQTVSFHPGVPELIQYLTEHHRIEAVGGITYIRNLFRGADPKGVYHG